MPPTTKALLVFAIVALVTPSFCTSQSYSTWNKISPSGPSIGPVTGHVGVPDHSSDAAFIFGGHSGDSIRSTNDVWMFTFHGKNLGRTFSKIFTSACQTWSLWNIMLSGFKNSCFVFWRSFCNRQLDERRVGAVSWPQLHLAQVHSSISVAAEPSNAFRVCLPQLIFLHRFWRQRFPRSERRDLDDESPYTNVEDSAFYNTHAWSIFRHLFSRAWSATVTRSRPLQGVTSAYSVTSRCDKGVPVHFKVRQVRSRSLQGATSAFPPTSRCDKCVSGHFKV